MSNPCYYHPDTQARSSCVQCGLPICDMCTDRINERTFCHKCVKAVRERMEKQMASPGLGAASGPSPSGYAAGGYSAPTATGSAWPPAPAQAYGGSRFVAAAQPLDASKMILGIVAALLIGIVGAIVVEKIYFYVGFSLSLLYILIGYGIGYGLCMVTRRGGMGMALLAVGIMVISLLIGQLVLTSDALNKMRVGSPELAGVTTAAVFPLLLSHMGFMYWICIAFGLYSCFKSVARQG